MRTESSDGVPGFMRSVGLAAIAGLGLWGAPAHAAFIAVTPLVETGYVGDTFTFDVRVGGLEPLFRPDQIVSAFDLDFYFNPSILAFSEASFGDTFGCDGDDGMAMAICGADASAGVVDFYAFSFRPEKELRADQGSSVLLASLSFTALMPGFSLVGVTPSWLDENFSLVGRLGRDGEPVDLQVLFNSPAIAKAVPEPGTVALLGLGLLGLAAHARRRGRAHHGTAG